MVIVAVPRAARMLDNANFFTFVLGDDKINTPLHRFLFIPIIGNKHIYGKRDGEFKSMLHFISHKL